MTELKLEAFLEFSALLPRMKFYSSFYQFDRPLFFYGHENNLSQYTVGWQLHIHIPLLLDFPGAKALNLFFT